VPATRALGIGQALYQSGNFKLLQAVMRRIAMLRESGVKIFVAAHTLTRVP
jgi:hypothetical protein